MEERIQRRGIRTTQADQTCTAHKTHTPEAHEARKDMMKQLFAALKKMRRDIWLACTASDEASWWAHLVLVGGGSGFPALVAWGLWSWQLAIVVGFAVSELFFDFMLAREVVDYLKHKAKGNSMKKTKRDGIGDIVGPLLVRLFWWGMLIFLLRGVL